VGENRGKKEKVPPATGFKTSYDNNKAGTSDLQKKSTKKQRKKDSHAYISKAK
jgi:hypothetical protein